MNAYNQLMILQLGLGSDDLGACVVDARSIPMGRGFSRSFGTGEGISFGNGHGKKLPPQVELVVGAAF